MPLRTAYAVTSGLQSTEDPSTHLGREVPLGPYQGFPASQTAFRTRLSAPRKEVEALQYRISRDVLLMNMCAEINHLTLQEILKPVFSSIPGALTSTSRKEAIQVAELHFIHLAIHLIHKGVTVITQYEASKISEAG